MSPTLAVVDGHVHIHACYPPGIFFDRAFENLTRYGVRGASTAVDRFLLMTECAPDQFFDALRAGSLNTREWRVPLTSEEQSVIVQNGERRLFVVGGRQVACREGLEVLILGTRQRFADHRPIREVLTEASALGVPHVIPWGPGKWFFARGRLVSQLLQEFRKPLLFLGDEGGRPAFWGYPSHFGEGAALGVRDLPGTDPLPFAHDITKVGRVGFRVPIELDAAHPTASLFAALANGATSLQRFASLEPPLRFVRNQVAMQLRKHRAA